VEIEQDRPVAVEGEQGEVQVAVQDAAADAV